MTDNTTKITYVAPSLCKKGRVEALTAGTSKGENGDAAFPVGTPFGDLTFS
ncbi:putative RiPP precursor [Tritonibacter horizontis]|uniref:Lasso RiPP family leader peptide-containing protein n=1 Tax=Tritonibacter horizontis TaxID=1768241 RepID=A0A132BYP4_9RHOB|nr:putative RiPP precursor [Tritonibacter horizontis]KUP93528.1 hypothetical protein TRIHO_15510 [Tritonibacter horizontis]